MLVPKHEMLLLADADIPFFRLVSSSFCSLEHRKKERQSNELTLRQNHLVPCQRIAKTQE